MDKKTLYKNAYVMAFLANIDSNIEKLKLEHSFTVKKIKLADYKDFIQNVKINTLNSLRGVLYPKYGIVNHDGYIYYIKGKTKDLIEKDKRFK